MSSSYPGTVRLPKYMVKAVSTIPFFSGVTVDPMRLGAEKKQLLNHTPTWREEGGSTGKEDRDKSLPIQK